MDISRVTFSGNAVFTNSPCSFPSKLCCIYHYSLLLLQIKDYLHIYLIILMFLEEIFSKSTMTDVLANLAKHSINILAKFHQKSLMATRLMLEKAQHGYSQYSVREMSKFLTEPQV